MALAKLARYNDHVVALDGDTKNSTFTELFKNEHPNRYVECYIAEQNMVRKRDRSSLRVAGGVLKQRRDKLHESVTKKTSGLSRYSS